MTQYYDFLPSQMTSLPAKGTLGGLAVVGLAPSTNRPSKNRLEPLGGRSLSILEKVLGSDIDLYLTNLIKEPYSTTKKVPVSVLREWGPRLIHELHRVKPTRILAIGGEVSKILIGDTFNNLTEDHGVFFRNEDLGCYVIPTFPFQNVMKHPAFPGIIARDIQRFGSVEPTEIPIFYKTTAFDLPEPGGTVILDIETTGLTHEAEITKVGLSYDGTYFILDNPDESELELLCRKLKGRTVIGHNIAFDVFQMANKAPRAPWHEIVYRDTMLLAHNTGLYDNLRLKHLITMLTDQPGPHSQGGFEDDSYLVSDLMGTKAVHDHHEREYKTYSGKLMCDMAGIFGQLRARGVYIDRHRLAHVASTLQTEFEELQVELDKVDNINWNSPQQVATTLVANGIPLTETTKSGNLSVAQPVLQTLEDEYPLVKTLVDYRGVGKLLSGFVLPYLENGHDYLYPSLLIHGTATGRLSCKDPNLQQIPREGPFKTIFRSRWDGGQYALVDLSQAELRVAALLSGDEKFTEALLSEDAHRYIASMAFNKPQEEITSPERKASKAITFGLLYGGSPEGLAKRAGIPANRVEEVLASFFNTFAKLSAWIETIRANSAYNDQVITPMGRRRNLADVRFFEGPNGVFRKAINTPVQSLASDIMLSIIRQSYYNLLEGGLTSRPLFPVHDSMILEVYPGELDAVVHAIQQAFTSLSDSPLSRFDLFDRIPFVGEIVVGETWASVESTNVDYYNPATEAFPCSSHGVVAA